MARLGPSFRGDVVGPDPVVFDLDDPPRGPAFSPIKVLPKNVLFFLDMRRIEEIRTAFVQENLSLGPGSQSPGEANRPDWLFQLSGTDPSLQIYPPPKNTREVTLQYDPRGFLTEMNERLGDSFDNINPRGTFDLRLVSERPL